MAHFCRNFTKQETMQVTGGESSHNKKLIISLAFCISLTLFLLRMVAPERCPPQLRVLHSIWFPASDTVLAGLETLRSNAYLEVVDPWKG